MKRLFLGCCCEGLSLFALKQGASIKHHPYSTDEETLYLAEVRTEFQSLGVLQFEVPDQDLLPKIKKKVVRLF